MVFKKVKSKRRRGQITVEYGFLIAAVLAMLIIFARFLSYATEKKINTFEDALVIRRQ